MRIIGGGNTTIKGIKGLQTALGPGARQLVSARSGVPSGLSTAMSGSGTVNATATSRVRTLIYYACGALKFRFDNYYCQSGNHEAKGTNNIDIVGVSLEDPTTTSGNIGGTALIPVFFGGKRGVTIEPGGHVWSDPVQVYIPAVPGISGVGTPWPIFVRTAVSVAAYGDGSQWTVNGRLICSNTGAVGLDGRGGSDSIIVDDAAAHLNSLSFSGAGGVSGNPFSFTCVTGVVKGGVIQPAALALTHSIGNGTGDGLGQGGTDLIQGSGWIARGLERLGIPVYQATVGGETATYVSSPANRYLRFSNLSDIGVNAIINELLTNDWGGSSRSVAQMQSDVAIITKAEAANNYLVYWCCEPPHATSTDGFQTAANQTPLTIAVSGATNANPIIVTTTTHGLADGEQVTIAGVVGNTNANGTYYVKVSSVGSATTFGLYTNAGLTTGRAGNSAYVSGGTCDAPSVHRILMNRWFRGTNGSAMTDLAGFLTGIIDPTTVCEVDTNGAAVVDGGVWKPGAVLLTITPTSGGGDTGGTSGVTLTDHATDFTAHPELVGAEVWVASGTGAGQMIAGTPPTLNQAVKANPGGSNVHQHSLSGNFTTAGVLYDGTVVHTALDTTSVVTFFQAASYDGVHPSTWQHWNMSRVITAALFGL